MKPHLIRLGAAWEPLQSAGGGSTTWRRRFGRPSGLQPGDRVILLWERSAPVTETPSFTLNGRPLPRVASGVSRWEHDVTALLDDRNELVLEADGPASIAETLDAHGRTDLPATRGSLVLAIVTG